MRPGSASLFDPTPELIRHHAFLSEGAGRHYATRTKVRSRFNLAGRRVVACGLACIRWSAAAISTKGPTLSHRTREGWGTRAHVVPIGILASHPFAENAKGWGTLILYLIIYVI